VQVIFLNKSGNRAVCTHVSGLKFEAKILNLPQVARRSFGE
jgi:hypothetical protein